MENVFVFNKTVIGSMHVSKGIPCEDFSASYSSEDGRYHIAVVADGHGSSACFRSSYGSKAATRITLECLKNFANTILNSEAKEKEFYRMFFFDPRYQQSTVKQLTDTIISKWHSDITEHYAANPGKQDEIKEDEDIKEFEKNVPHIYGTTLMAALMLPQCLILIHQGDGRCNVFYEDGSVDQPVPWDSRCEFNTTTSICDSDVSTSFRHKVINLSEKKVMACYLGSDGVEDAYRDTWESLGESHDIMGGVYTFYKYLSCRIYELGTESFSDFLEEMLPSFSEIGLFSNSGSGDDVSVAGIVHISAIANLVKRYQFEIDVYKLEEKRFWQEEALRSKTRKHGILKKRLDEASLVIINTQKEYDEAKLLLDELYCQKDEVKSRYDEEQEKLQQAQIAKAEAENNRKFPDYLAKINSFLSPMGLSFAQYQSTVETNISSCLVECQNLNNSLKEKEEKIKSQQDIVLAIEKKLADAKSNYESAEKKFLDYDEKYSLIETEISKINNQIEKLKEDYHAI